MLGFDRVADRRKDVDRVLVSACYVKPPRFSRIRQRSRGAVEQRRLRVASSDGVSRRCKHAARSAGTRSDGRAPVSLILNLYIVTDVLLGGATAGRRYYVLSVLVLYYINTRIKYYPTLIRTSVPVRIIGRNAGYLIRVRYG